MGWNFGRLSRRGADKGQDGVNPAFTSGVYQGIMRNDLLGKMGLAAFILFAPGGFILGAALAANHYRRRDEKRD
jgi:hypothetical protein